MYFLKPQLLEACDCVRISAPLFFKGVFLALLSGENSLERVTLENQSLQNQGANKKSAAAVVMVYLQAHGLRRPILMQHVERLLALQEL